MVVLHLRLGGTDHIHANTLLVSHFSLTFIGPHTTIYSIFSIAPHLDFFLQLFNRQQRQSPCLTESSKVRISILYGIGKPSIEVAEPFDLESAAATTI